MAIAPTLQKYLDSNVIYDVITHEPTMSSTHTAQACHISGNRLAKGIVLRRNGGYLLAVLPASRHIQLDDVAAELGEPVELAFENEIGALFGDCARGAIPPFGDCYGLQTIVDDSVAEQPEIYFEAGDHSTLIRMDAAQFAALTADAMHGRFSVRA